MTAPFDLAAPGPAPELDAGRRRARIHLDDAGPFPVHGVVSAVAESAARLGLGGFARTDPHGLTVEVEGRAAAVTHFLGRLAGGPLAACWTPGGELAPLGASEFAVLAVSAQRTAATAHRGSDVGLCAACVETLFDRTSPRFLDPAIGCPACRRGEESGLRCALRLVDAGGSDIEGNPLKSAMALLLVGGRVLATRDARRLRLYADATRPAAVGALATVTDRSTEGRLVVLCPDVEWARRLALVDDAEAAALSSRRNPVLLVEPLPVGPARDLTPPGSPLAVTLPGCGMTHLMARAAARPLAYLDLPPVVGTAATDAVPPAMGLGIAPAIGTLFAERVV